MKETEPTTHLTQFTLQATGHVAVYGGKNKGDEKPWREDRPVVGWALRLRRFPDGSKESEIVPLVEVNDGEGASIAPADECSWPPGERPVYVLPPNPTAEDIEDASRCAQRRYTQQAQAEAIEEKATAVINPYLETPRALGTNRQRRAQSQAPSGRARRTLVTRYLKEAHEWLYTRRRYHQTA